MAENTKVFAEGIGFKRPREGAPDFVKGSFWVKATEFTAFLEKHKNNDGFVNLDFLKSKDGKTLYLALNDWKPAQEAPAPTATPADDPEDPSSIPF